MGEDCGQGGGCWGYDSDLNYYQTEVVAAGTDVDAVDAVLAEAAGVEAVADEVDELWSAGHCREC